SSAHWKACPPTATGSPPCPSSRGSEARAGGETPGPRSPAWASPPQARRSSAPSSRGGPSVSPMCTKRLGPLAPPGPALIAPGGALHGCRAWSQIVVDALGVPIEVRENTEASSRGAALLALAELGASAPAPGRPGRVLRPDPRCRDVYARARERQAGLYGSV